MRRLALICALALAPVLSWAALNQDATANPSGALIKKKVLRTATDHVTSDAVSTAGTNRLFVVFTSLVINPNPDVGVIAPVTVSWSDSSGNSASPPSGCAAFAKVTGSDATWNAPYANQGQCNIWYAFCSSAVTNGFFAATRGAPSSATDRTTGIIAGYAYYSDTAGKIPSIGATGTPLLNVQDPPSPTVAMTVTVNAQAAGSRVAGIFWDNNSSIDLVASATTVGDYIDNSSGAGTNSWLTGQLASGGTVTVTSGAGNVTIGTTRSDNYVSGTAVEIKEVSSATGRRGAMMGFF